MSVHNEKPSISILMAIYDPNLDWLREQMISLNQQTYPNLKLYICDDCSPNIPFGVIKEYAQQYITAFPFELTRNEVNKGSNKTFEHLTDIAVGDYFAYCDQDDIWLPEKLDVLCREAIKTGASLVCSDVYIINGDGETVANSITEVKRHIKYKSGENIADQLLVSNFVTGCTSLVRADKAKSAIPFCPYMVHDQYIAMKCADNGKLISLPDKLIKYRIHDSNQTPVMKGVTDKESYGIVRIGEMLKRMTWLNENYRGSDHMKNTISDGLKWATARESNWNHRGGGRTVWRFRKFSLMPSVYEVLFAWLPEPIFKLLLSAAKKNII